MDWSRVRHFTRDEFGYAPDVEPDPTLVQMLNDARAMAGVPFVITSGIRTEDHNAEVGGSETSSHLTGHAVDISVETSNWRFLIVDALRECGARRIGIADDFIHVDTDEGKPQDVLWVY